ncbi:MAG TPA: bifunctional oligoribonuclease/PAP phosphatase NrnA [Verrucomicrobiales bacterium]|nr:bifunctional oligoribonuclease/PAP phosphatase NrnA [Verrucomicrobiales bacterium]
MTGDASQSLDEVTRALEEAGHVAIASHVRPDGDAIGSQVALAHGLRNRGKQVTLLNEDGVPGNLAFLPGAAWVDVSSGRPCPADLVVAVDTAARSRLGERTLASLPKEAPWINLDHHASNPRYGTINYVDADSPATGEIVAQIFVRAGWELTPEASVNLFAAISTDTGSFRYPNTSAGTFRVAADLVTAGVDVGDLSRRLYDCHPVSRIRLLGELLQVLDLRCDGRLASWSLDRGIMERVNCRPEDSEGLIDVIRSIDTVVAAVFFEELEDGEQVRISARSKSKTVDVGAICAEFGGGGHPLAAGVRVRGRLAEVRESFLQRIEDVLEGTN